MVGLVFQTGTAASYNTFELVTKIICTIYYIVAITLGFYAYRYWKANLQDFMDGGVSANDDFEQASGAQPA